MFMQTLDSVAKRFMEAPLPKLVEFKKQIESVGGARTDLQVAVVTVLDATIQAKINMKNRR